MSSLFDDAEKLAGAGGEDGVVQDVTQDAEQFADNETGGKFDSEIQDAGNALDQQADKDLPNL
jgi:hypothetical protein